MPSGEVSSVAAGQQLGRSVKLALVTSGLGNINRGFEVSTARWYEALSRNTDIDVRLFCGGSYTGGKQLWNFPRNSAWTRPINFIPFLSEEQKWQFTYGVEQVSFWSALNFELLDFRPDVVWLKDLPLAYLLRASRIAFGLKFKIIFANGGMLRPESYAVYDVIQQIENRSYEEGLQFGIPQERMELISNCVPLPKQRTDHEIREARHKTRQSLGLKDNDWVIVCVAAWNKYHKRIDYLLEEVANFDDPNCRLLLCGTPEVDTKELKLLGNRLLGDRVQWLSVSQEKLTDILHASDVFVLPSLREHLGNAQIEAILCGLPLIVHPHDGARFVVEDDYWMTDLSQAGNLTRRLVWMRENAEANLERIKRIQGAVALRFSEEALSVKFESMVKCATMQTITNLRSSTNKGASI